MFSDLLIPKHELQSQIVTVVSGKFETKFL